MLHIMTVLLLEYLPHPSLPLVKGIRKRFGELVHHHRYRDPEVCAESLWIKILCFSRGDAKAVALPILDVTSEDVECSHGASISTFDEGVVRYLSSRGVSKGDQEILLIESVREWGQL